MSKSLQRFLKGWMQYCWLLFSAVPAQGIDVTLEWNPNIEQDLSGYKIYYKTDYPGPPYDGWRAFEGDSPITVDANEALVGDICRFTLHDLDDAKKYYFAITAYDIEENESEFSNEVCSNCIGEYACMLIPNTFLVQRGEKLQIDVRATNRSGDGGIAYFGSKVIDSEGTTHPSSGFLVGPYRTYLGPYALETGQLMHTVPLDWPLGYSLYQGYIKMPHIGNLQECAFVFEVVGAPR